MNMMVKWWKCWQGKVIVITALLSVLAPFICNENPLVCYEANGRWSFPAFETENQPAYPDSSACTFVVNALIPYSPGRSDLMNADFTSPFDQQVIGRSSLSAFRQRHWLGTDLRGSDVLVDMIFAMRNSVFISVIATIISFVIGSFLGVAGGWNAGRKLKARWSEVWMWMLSGFLLLFALSELKSWQEQSVFLLVSVLLVVLSGKFINFMQTKWIRKVRSVGIPVVFIIDRVSELFLAIPRLLLLMVIIQFLPRSIGAVAFAIGITSWIDISRLIKAEVIILREQAFVEAAGMSGMSKLRLFLRHLLPSIWPSVMVVLMYCFSGNILMDASLSFFGFGLPPDVLSIGGMLATARTYYEAWWMFLFPGAWISVLIYAVFTLPDALLKLKPSGY